MKIFMIIKRLRYSGAYLMFMWVARMLANRGYHVTVCTYMISEINELPDNIEWVQLDLENASFFKRLVSIRKEIKRRRPDVSISFLLDSNIFNIFACLFTRTKSVVCERNDPFKPGYYKLKLAKPLFRFAKGAVYQLPEVAKYYSNITAPYAIIPNPVICKENIELPPFEKRENAFVTVGRLDLFQKRQDVLIRAFAIFIKKYPDYKLYIYGKGGDLNEIKSLVYSLNLEGQIVLPGEVLNPLEKVALAKVFVLSSDFEGIPNALIEAMSIGMPCISTDCRPGGAELLIERDKRGFMVPAGDVESLADKMIYVVEHPEEAENKGNLAKGVVDCFSESKIGDMWCDYVESIKPCS